MVGYGGLGGGGAKGWWVTVLHTCGPASCLLCGLRSLGSFVERVRVCVFHDRTGRVGGEGDESVPFSTFAFDEP